LSADEVALGFSADGKNLLTQPTASHSGLRLWISLPAAASPGRKSLLPTLPACKGFDHQVQRDGKSYAYSTLRVLSDLYVVDGLK